MKQRLGNICIITNNETSAFVDKFWSGYIGRLVRITAKQRGIMDIYFVKVLTPFKGLNGAYMQKELWVTERQIKEFKVKLSDVTYL